MKIREGYWREKLTKRVVITRRTQRAGEMAHMLYYYEDDDRTALGHRVHEGWKNDFEWIGTAADLPTKEKVGLSGPDEE